MFSPGDHVTWLYESTRGWGFSQRVPATVVRVTRSRVIIDARLKHGGTARRTVRADKLTRRPTMTESLRRLDARARELRQQADAVFWWPAQENADTATRDQQRADDIAALLRTPTQRAHEDDMNVYREYWGMYF